MLKYNKMKSTNYESLDRETFSSVLRFLSFKFTYSTQHPVA
jgi:hypothetical protein